MADIKDCFFVWHRGRQRREFRNASEADMYINQVQADKDVIDALYNEQKEADPYVSMVKVAYALQERILAWYKDNPERTIN